MSEVQNVGPEMIEPDPECNGRIRTMPVQTIVGDRLAWSISSTCDRCTFQTAACGWDEPPEEVRHLLLDRDGTARLRVRADVGRPLRLPILRVLRRDGAALDEVTRRYTLLTDVGMTGTPIEMRLLADRLTAIGAAAHLEIVQTPAR